MSRLNNRFTSDLFQTTPSHTLRTRFQNPGKSCVLRLSKIHFYYVAISTWLNYTFSIASYSFAGALFRGKAFALSVFRL